MTYAPADLLAVQRYAHDKTGQPWDALGIIHGSPQGGGYHEGHDLLHAAGTAPEDPGSDYSYTESQRDRAGLTDAGSAFDFGNGFPRFYEFNNWLASRARAGDPRCRDIREIIYTPDGRVVRRFDALGIRSSGDSSHLTHTHTSFFRDSEGRRHLDDNFLGLLKEFFDGGTAMAYMDDPNAAAQAWRLDGLAHARDAVLNGPAKGEPLELVQIIKRIEQYAKAAAGQAAPVTMTDADREDIANRVAAKLGPEMASAVADEVAKRLGNG